MITAELAMRATVEVGLRSVVCPTACCCGSADVAGRRRTSRRMKPSWHLACQSTKYMSSARAVPACLLQVPACLHPLHAAPNLARSFALYLSLSLSLVLSSVSLFSRWRWPNSVSTVEALCLLRRFVGSFLPRVNQASRLYPVLLSHQVTCMCGAGADGLNTQVVSAGADAGFERATLIVGLLLMVLAGGMLLTVLAWADRACIRAGRVQGARAGPLRNGSAGRRRPCPRPLARPPASPRGDSN